MTRISYAEPDWLAENRETSVASEAESETTTPTPETGGVRENIVERLRLAMRQNAAWDPDLHPRDRKGRFRETLIDQLIPDGMALVNPDIVDEEMVEEMLGDKSGFAIANDKRFEYNRYSDRTGASGRYVVDEEFADPRPQNIQAFLFPASDVDTDSDDVMTKGEYKDQLGIPEGDYELSQIESVSKDFPDRFSSSMRGQEFIKDGKRVYHRDVKYGDDIVYKEQLPDGEYNERSVYAPDATPEEFYDGVIEERANIEDFDQHEVTKLAYLAMGNALEPMGTTPDYDWVAIRDVFEAQSDAALKEAIYDAFYYKNGADTEHANLGSDEDKKSLEQLFNYPYERGELRDTPPRLTRTTATPFTHLDGEAQVEVFDQLRADLDQFDEVYETDPDIGTPTRYEPRREARERLAEVAIRWGDPAVREHAKETMPQAAETVTALQDHDSYESFRSHWASGWASRGGNYTAEITMNALEAFRANEGQDVTVWTGGRPNGSIAISEQTKQYFERLYQETQEQLDRSSYTLYRGVGNEVNTHSSLESWTRAKSTANKDIFDGHAVLEAEVDAADVLATYETLGDDWDEDGVKGKREFMVLGGAFEAGTEDES